MKKICLSMLVFTLAPFANATTTVNFHNNTNAVVHLDYPESKFCTFTNGPKPDEIGNLPAHSAVTISCSVGDTLQFVQYSGPYKNNAKCFLNSTNDAFCTVSGSKMTLHWPKEEIDYPQIKKNIQKVLDKFSANQHTQLTLIPNVVPMNTTQLAQAEEWSLKFGYDASRYPLFNGANCLANRSSTSCKESEKTVAGLLATMKANSPEMNRQFTLPTDGFWAYKVGNAKVGSSVEGSAYPAESGGSPALDGPIAVAELAIHGKTPFYEGLIRTLKKYDLAVKTPASAKNEGEFVKSTSPYFNGSLALLTQAILVGNGDLEQTRKLPATMGIQSTNEFSKADFMRNYDTWLKSGFLTKFVATTKVGNEIKKVDSLRVIFTVQNAPHTSQDNWENVGNSPTVSEGMAYGLLIAYAANDQKTFNELLNFVLFEASIHGCAGVNADQTSCSIKSRYLMPWLVDETGRPLHYTIGGGYITNGSATDADINIAWALKLAAAKQKTGEWQLPYQFDGLSYAEIVEQMRDEIARFDISKDVEFFGEKIGKLYSPGSQWGDNGKNVLYPGYDAPQAFEALAK